MRKKSINFLFCKFPHVEKFRRQWNLSHIYSNKNSEKTNECRRWKNIFKREKLVVFVEYLEQQTDYRRYKRKIRKSRQGINHIYLSLSSKWKPSHGTFNSRPHYVRTAQEKYFRFHLNFKQIQVEAKNSLSNLFLTFLWNYIFNIENIFTAWS